MPQPPVIAGITSMRSPGRTAVDSSPRSPLTETLIWRRTGAPLVQNPPVEVWLTALERPQRLDDGRALKPVLGATPGERTKRASWGGHRTGLTRSQQVAVIDAVRAEGHRGDQGHHLAARIRRPRPLAKVDSLIENASIPSRPCW
jgi:hypothetical protein